MLKICDNLHRRYIESNMYAKKLQLNALIFLLRDIYVHNNKYKNITKLPCFYNIAHNKSIFRY